MGLGIGIQYTLIRKGPMAMGASEDGISCKIMEELNVPNIKFHNQPLNANKPGLKCTNFHT